MPSSTTHSQTHYELLGLPFGSSESEIRKAYKKLALQYHPDKNPGHEDKFKALLEAHETLCDASKRTLYDAKIAIPTPRTPPKPAAANWRPGTQSSRFQTQYANFNTYNAQFPGTDGPRWTPRPSYREFRPKASQYTGFYTAPPHKSPQANAHHRQSTNKPDENDGWSSRGRSGRSQSWKHPPHPRPPTSPDQPEADSGESSTQDTASSQSAREEVRDRTGAFRRDSNWTPSSTSYSYVSGESRGFFSSRTSPPPETHAQRPGPENEMPRRDNDSSFNFKVPKQEGSKSKPTRNDFDAAQSSPDDDADNSSDFDPYSSREPSREPASDDHHTSHSSSPSDPAKSRFKDIPSGAFIIDLTEEEIIDLEKDDTDSQTAKPDVQDNKEPEASTQGTRAEPWHKSDPTSDSTTDSEPQVDAESSSEAHQDPQPTAQPHQPPHNKRGTNDDIRGASPSKRPRTGLPEEAYSTLLDDFIDNMPFVPMGDFNMDDIGQSMPKHETTESLGGFPAAGTAHSTPVPEFPRSQPQDPELTLDDLCASEEIVSQLAPPDAPGEPMSQQSLEIKAYGDRMEVYFRQWEQFESSILEYFRRRHEADVHYNLLLLKTVPRVVVYQIALDVDRQVRALHSAAADRHSSVISGYLVYRRLVDGS